MNDMYLKEDETLHGNYKTLVALRNTHLVGQNYVAAREIDDAIRRYETYRGARIIWVLTIAGLILAGWLATS